MSQRLTESGERQAPARSGSILRDGWVKVVTGSALLVLATTSGMLFAHERRVTVLETQRTEKILSHKEQHKALQKTLDGMQVDLKKLLEER